MADDNTNPAPRQCQECGKDFSANRPQQAFCCPAHKTAFHNRSMKRGKVMIPLLMTWQSVRGAPGSEEAEVRAYARARVEELSMLWREEDKGAGRPSMYPIAKAKMDAAWRGVDLDL